MKVVVGFLCLVLGGVLGGGAGYYVALQNQPPSRLPTDISHTLLADFDLKKVLDQLQPNEPGKSPLTWNIVKDAPGKGDLKRHKEFLQSYQQHSQEHSAQVLGIKTRVIVAQSKLPAAEQNEYWTLLHGLIKEAIVNQKMNVAVPPPSGGGPVWTAFFDYYWLPGDRSPYPMRGAMHVAMVADGDNIRLIITMTEVFHTT